MLRNTLEASVPVAGRTDLIEALQVSSLPMLVEVHDWSQLPADFRAGIAQRNVVVVRPEQRLR